MTNAVSLSLGIPVYNQAATIEQTVASALSQTEPFDEIVVVDNHSTDGTAERLASFSGRIRIIQPPQHLSMCDNWNFCVGAMDSDWFSLLSGDDLLKPDFAKHVRQAATAHPDAVLIRTDWDVIDGEGKITAVHHQLSVSRITKPPKTWQEQLYGPKVSFAAFACRKDAWKKVGGFRRDFDLFHDWMLWLEVAPLGPFIRIPESLAQYRVMERPVIDRQRLIPTLADEHRYLLQVLPALPLPQRTILRVRRRRLKALLSFMSRYLAELESGNVQQQLRDLAVGAGMTETVDAWLRHPRALPPSTLEELASAAKNTARLLLNSVRAYRRPPDFE